MLQGIGVLLLRSFNGKIISAETRPEGQRPIQVTLGDISGPLTS
jgi:hypothetical protein